MRKDLAAAEGARGDAVGADIAVEVTSPAEPAADGGGERAGAGSAGAPAAAQDQAAAEAAATRIQAAQRGNAVRLKFHADEWFYVNKERERESVTFAELAKLYKSQAGVVGTTSVYGGDLTEWTPAMEVPVLAPFAPSVFALREASTEKSRGTTFVQRLKQSRLDQKMFVRRCLGELKNGAHESTLQHNELTKRAQSMVNILTPRLNAEGLSYDTLRLSPVTNRLNLNNVPAFKMVLDKVKDLPGPGAKIPVVARCARIALYDGVRFVSNLRREVCTNKDTEEDAPWQFNARSAVVLKGGDLTADPGTAVRAKGNLQVYIELNLVYNLTDEVPELHGMSQATLGYYMRGVGFTQEDLDAASKLGQLVNEITTAWCLIPFPECSDAGIIKEPKNIHVPLYCGTINNPVPFPGTKGGALPGNEKARASEATFMGSFLGDDTDGVPRLLLRLDKLDQRESVLDKRNGPVSLSERDASRALPKHFICSMQALNYLAMYRFALADALLGSNPAELIGLGVPNVEPRWDPLLKMFPAVLDDPMLFFAFSQLFEKIPSAQRGATYEEIKATMELQLYRIWPLRQSLSLPPRGSDVQVDYQIKRYSLIRAYVMDQATEEGLNRALGTGDGFRHKPFNVADMTYCYATQGELAWNFVKTS